MDWFYLPTADGKYIRSLPWSVPAPRTDSYVIERAVISFGAYNHTFDIELANGNRLYSDGNYYGIKDPDDVVLNRINIAETTGNALYVLEYSYTTNRFYIMRIPQDARSASGIYLRGIFNNGDCEEGSYHTWASFLSAWDEYQYRNYCKAGINIAANGHTVEFRWGDGNSSAPPYYALSVFQNYTDVRITEYIQDIVLDHVPGGDPYAPGGISEPEAGEATFDFTSEPIDFQDAPAIGAYDTGMVSLYVPTAANLQSLASYLWAGAFDVNNFRKLVADPMDVIIGLSIVPLTATQIGTTSATLMVGNISTTVSMPRANKQYVVVDCGTINILPKWGAYLDFAPYSKLQLFLPYIGYVDISPDDCMNTTISVKYVIDILSGSCVAQVKCSDHVLYEYSGTCSCPCPVTAGQYQNVVMGALRGIGAVAAIAGGYSSGNVGAAMSGLNEAISTVRDSVKPEVSRSGGFGGSSGLMGHQTPYLVLTIPRLCIPGEQEKMIGYPSFVTSLLGDLTGFCAIETIHISGIAGASTDDLDEIDTLLKRGVFL